MFGHRRRRRPGLPGHHVLTSATKKVDVAVLSTIAGREGSGASFGTNFNAIFTVKNNGVGYGKISTRIAPALKAAVESIRKQIASGKIKVIGRRPRRRRPARRRHSRTPGGAGFGSRPSGMIPAMSLRSLVRSRCSRARRRACAARGLRRRRRRGRRERRRAARPTTETGGRHGRRPGPSIKVGLVTDIGGLDDRSFNFLANQGLERAEEQLGVEGRVVDLARERRLRPEPLVARAAGLRPHRSASAS